MSHRPQIRGAFVPLPAGSPELQPFRSRLLVLAIQHPQATFLVAATRLIWN